MSSNPAQPSHEAAVGPEEWVERYGDGLFRFAKSRLHNISDAEELVQETFLTAIRAQRQFTGSGSQWKWLLSILSNKIVDTIRQRERKYAAAAARPTDGSCKFMFDANGAWRSELWPACPAPQVLELQELRQIVQRCLAQIPHLQASVFVLSVMNEMDHQVICRELEITPANLAVRLHRARLGIAKCVQKQWFKNDESSTRDE